MAKNNSNRNFFKDARNCRRNQESAPDETALRDEILKLKRQVMALRRTNEQNLVKFRKYEEEAKRKDREIQQLMDPRKNADVTKVLSIKGAAILMTLKDQNNALIQMVLNKDVQIRRLLAEMKMSKLYASVRGNASYKEEIARLKTLLAKSREKLKADIDKEKEAKSMCANEFSFLEFSSSEDSSPRDSEELRFIIRGLEAHLKNSNDLLNKKDQEISLLNDELNFLKELLQHKTCKKNFDYHPTEILKYTINDTHSEAQTSLADIIPRPSKISGTEILQIFEKSPETGNKILSSSEPASFTGLSESNGTISKHKSLSDIAGNDNWKYSKVEGAKVTKTDATLVREIAVGENPNKENITSEFEKVERVREHKKILMKRREPKKRIPKKFVKKKFFENEKKIRNVPLLKALKSKKNEENVDGQIISEIFKIMDSKEEDGKIQIFSEAENSDFRTKIEESNKIQGSRISLTINCDLHDAEKDQEGLNSNDSSGKYLKTDSGGSEIVGINSPAKVKNCRMSDEENNSINFRREIYRQSIDSSFESENGYPIKQQVQQVQVEVQIDSITVENDDDELENSTREHSHQGEFIETRGDNCAPDDGDNNNDDDNDVIFR